MRNLLLGHAKGSMNLWLLGERAAWAVGITSLTVYGTILVAGSVQSRRALQRFAALQASAASGDAIPDLTDWSPARVRAWRDTHGMPSPPPIAVLRIPRIALTVAVLEGTDEWTLNRAVGHIEDTARPGGSGNLAIAGHRDGFFRGLQSIGIGDVIEVETLGGVDRYRVERTWIVEPEDVSVIQPTRSPSITLVTCYPFYFIGAAPQRFIVRGVLEATTARAGARE